MGWKNVKEHYRIEHIVHVSEGLIRIGSGFISVIITINPDGKPVWSVSNIGRSNDDLCRYMREMEADLPKLKELIESPDTFHAAIPVFTYEQDGTITEDHCEKSGWPNVTHRGALQYDSWFDSKEKAIARAKVVLKANVESVDRSLAERQAELDEFRKVVEKYHAGYARLMKDYP